MMNQDFRAPQDWFTSTNELHERVTHPTMSSPVLTE